jgi:hypothetical protein
MHRVDRPVFSTGLATLVVVKHLHFEAVTAVAAPEPNALSHM